MNHGIFVKFPMSSRADIMQWQNMVRKCRIFFYWCHNAKRRCAYSKARACTFFLFNRNRRIPKFQACKHSCTLWCWYALTMARRAESTEEENDMGKKKRKSVIAQWKIRKSFKPFNFPSAIVYTTLADKGIWCSCSFYHRLKIRFLKAKKKRNEKERFKWQEQRKRHRERGRERDKKNIANEKGKSTFASYLLAFFLLSSKIFLFSSLSFSFLIFHRLMLSSVLRRAKEKTRKIHWMRKHWK